MPAFLLRPVDSSFARLYLDANDGGIKRGDRGDVDDTEARPTIKEPPGNANEEDPEVPNLPDPDADINGEPPIHDPDAIDTDIRDPRPPPDRTGTASLPPVD